MMTSRMALVISCFGTLLGCAATTRRAAEPTRLAAAPAAVRFHILRSGPRIDVVEIGADGEASRSATFNGRNNRLTEGYGIAQERNGGFVMARYHATGEGVVEMMIRRVDADGRITWNHTFRDAVISDDETTCLSVRADGERQGSTECPMPQGVAQAR
jgi:hypothetical protein